VGTVRDKTISLVVNLLPSEKYSGQGCTGKFYQIVKDELILSIYKL
jgi:hypothetical protein